MADIYNPVARHFNPALAYANQQKAAATGRGSSGSLPVSTARRAIMQGPLSGLGGQSGATTATEALSALGQPDAPSLDAAVDSPDLASLGGGSGPSGMGSAPLGLGSSNSRIASTRGPGESPDTGIAAGAGEKSGQAAVDAIGQVGKNAAKTAGTSSLLALAAKAPFGEAMKYGFMAATSLPALGMSLATTGFDKFTDYLAHDVYAPARAQQQEAMKGWATPEEQAQHLASTIENEPVIANPVSYGIPSAISSVLGFDPVPSTRPVDFPSDLSQSSLSLSDLDNAFAMAVEKANLPTDYSFSQALGLTPMDQPMDQPESMTALGMPAQEQPTSLTALAHPDSRANMQSTRGAVTDTDYGRGGWAGVSSNTGVHSFAGEDPGYSGGGHAESSASSVGTGYGANDPSNPSGSNSGPMGGPSIGGPSSYGSGRAGSDSGDGEGEGTIICTALHAAGYLDGETWDADQEFGSWLRENDPAAVRGYHAWARPVVRAMQASPRFCRVVWFVARPWAEEMAHRAGHGQGNFIGRLMVALGVPACRVLGLLLGREREAGEAA